MSRRHASARPNGPSQRQLRVGEMLRHALSEILLRGDIRDPDLFGVSVTITQVIPSGDMRYATVYCEPLGGKNADKIIAALNRNKAYLRGEMGHTITLKFTPELRFVEDTVVRRSREDRDHPQIRRACSAIWQTPRAEDETAMAVGRRASPVHGWVVLDKPQGVTSTAGRRHRQARVRGAEGGPCRNARSDGDGRPGRGAGRSDQDRALRHGRREDLSLHRLLGRERAIPTMPRAP